MTSKLSGLDPMFQVRLRSAIERDGRLVTQISEAAIGSRGALAGILERGRKSPRADTVLALARELDVSVEWLLTGAQAAEGPPAGAPYSNRWAARSYAIAIGVSVDVIARVDRMVPADKGDPHPDEWLALYRGLDAERRFAVTRSRR